MDKNSLIAIILFIIPIFSSAQNSSSDRVIIWDSIGQTELISKSENYNIVYGKANPENTRVKYTEKEDNTYILELTHYNDLNNENNPFETKYQKILVNYDSLNKVHQSLSEKLTAASKIKSEKEENKINEINTELSKSPDLRKPKTFEILTSDLDKKEVEKSNEKISSITKEIKDNINEYSLNEEKIKEIKDRIENIITQGGSSEELENIQKELDNLLARNSELQVKISDLNDDRDNLIADNKLKVAELEYQSNLNILLIFIAIVILFLLGFIYRAYRNKKKANKIIEMERAKSESLLHNILPKPIADRLKKSEIIADEFEDAGVIFIDLVDFTKISDNAPPAGIVNVLNEVFTICDKIAEKYGIEKIKTIGDCYMAASGIPISKKGHNIALANMAIEVMNNMKEYRTPDGTSLKFRIGLDSGPVVAGVIGENKFLYDLWGDTVNTASRMEEFGAVNKIQCSDRFMKKLSGIENNGDFNFEDRGNIEIKGKGTMHTWFLKWEN